MGGGGGNWSGFGAMSTTGYTDTEIGQVITMAYLDAYTHLVDQLGGLPGANGSSAPAASAQQAVTMTKPGNMYTSASPKSKKVRPLDVGMMLYPTGNKDGI